MSTNFDRVSLNDLFLKLGIGSTISKYYGYIEHIEKVMLMMNKSTNLFWKKHRSAFINLHSTVHPLRSDIISMLSDCELNGSIGFDQSLTFHWADDQYKVEKFIKLCEEKWKDLNESHFEPCNTELNQLKIWVIDELDILSLESLNWIFKLWVPSTLKHLYIGGGYYSPLDPLYEILPELLPCVTERLEIVCFEVDIKEDLEVIFKYSYNVKNIVLYDLAINDEPSVNYDIDEKEDSHDYKLENLCLKYTLIDGEDDKLSWDKLGNLITQFSKIKAFKNLKTIWLPSENNGPIMLVIGHLWHKDLKVEECKHSEYEWEKTDLQS